MVEYLIGSIIALVVVWILYSIPLQRLFKKAGVSGGLAWIPLYNQWKTYKITWTGWIFWIFIILAIVPYIIILIAGDVDHTYGDIFAMDVAVLITLIVIWCLDFILHILSCYKVCRSYSHGVGFTIGLIFLHIIFLYILAFTKSPYLGVGGKGGAAND